MRKLFLFVYLLTILLFPLSISAQQSNLSIIPTRDKLLNDLPIVVLPRPSSGGVVLHVVIKSGATFDLVNKAGLADLTSQMIVRGTEDFKTLEQLQEELEFIGVRLEINTYWDSTEIRILGSSSKLESMIKLLNQILTKPTFPKDEVEKLKAERLKELENNPAISLEETFYHSLYGKHPYGHNIIGTKESINNINRGDILEFFNRFYLANNSVLIATGEVSLDRLLIELRKGLGGWKKGNPPPYTFTPPANQTGLNIHLKEKANANPEIILGYFSTKRTDPDYLATQLLVNILNQRLAKNSNWKVTANLVARKLTGTFLVSTQATNNNSTEVISSLIGEIKKLNTLDTEEIQAAKEKLQTEFYANTNTNTEIAAKWAELENYNIGSTYVKDFPLILSRISNEQLQQIANKYLTADNLLVTVTGKVSELEPNLKKLGKVEIIGQAPSSNETSEKK